ncbi:class I ribonucleotide reductase maintenance protein YfaE [Shewanella cyperi]|nr:class I ribonucleotide reductase maintenance protein YfaE [Shewanella cyperi]
MKMSSLTLTCNKAPIVSLNGQPVLLFNGQQHTLLQALEVKKIKVFSECRSGYCGACKTRVISGSVRYLTEPLAVLGEDECLPCCCVPSKDLDLDLSAKGADLVNRPVSLHPQAEHLLID